jgi:hypothetical protein
MKPDGREGGYYDFSETSADIVHSVTQRRLLKTWTQLTAEDGRALWERFKSEETLPLFENVSLFAVKKDGGAVRFQLLEQGPGVRRLYGADCTGKFLDEILPLSAQQAALAPYYQAVLHQRPAYTVTALRDTSNRPVSYERLLLPFASRDGQHRILASLEAISVEGAFGSLELLTPGQTPILVTKAILNVAAAP